MHAYTSNKLISQCERACLTAVSTKSSHECCLIFKNLFVVYILLFMHCIYIDWKAKRVSRTQHSIHSIVNVGQRELTGSQCCVAVCVRLFWRRVLEEFVEFFSVKYFLNGFLLLVSPFSTIPATIYWTTTHCVHCAYHFILTGKYANELYAHNSAKDDGNEISFEDVWLQTKQWNFMVGLYPLVMMNEILFKCFNLYIHKYLQWHNRS